MRTVIFFGAAYIALGFFMAYQAGRSELTVALQGCEIVAAQASRDATEAEAKAATCDSIFNNLEHLDEGLEH